MLSGETREQGSFVLYYFFKAKLNPFGHLAVGDFRVMRNGALTEYRDNQNAPYRYLSFRDGSQLVRNVPLALSHEAATYYNDYLTFSMPLCDMEKLRGAIETFASQDLSTYKVTQKNCATVAAQFIVDTGVFPQEKIPGILPQYVAKQVCNSLLKNLRFARDKIHHSNLPTFEKIKQLLENDIQRLELTIKRDVVVHISAIDRPKVKKEKIAQLKALLTKVTAASASLEQKHDDMNYAQLLLDFIQCKEAVKGETARRVTECIELLPLDTIPDLYNSPHLGPLSLDAQRRLSAFEMEHAVVHRHSILQDKDLKGMAKIIQLIGNDIERLRATLHHDQTDNSTAVFKNSAAKVKKIYELQQLKALFSASNPSYEQCWKKLLEEIQHIEGKTATGLTQCLRHFPYDKVEGIDKKSMLDKVDQSEEKYHEYRLEQLTHEKEFLIDTLLHDDCDDAFEEIKKLMLTHYEILFIKTRLQHGKPSLVDHVPADFMALTKIKTLFANDSISHEHVIDSLTSEMKLSKQSQDLVKMCIGHFPYERLPTIELKRAQLIALFIAINQNNLFAHNDTLGQLWGLLQSEAMLEEICLKSIYHLHLQVTQIFTGHSTKEHKNADKHQVKFDEIHQAWKDNIEAVEQTKSLAIATQTAAEPLSNLKR